VIIEGGRNVSPNTNCLEGKRCSACGSYGPFEVAVKMRVLLCDSGIDSAPDPAIEYDDNAHATCRSCGRQGRFGDFAE
jgi:ribosomal protein L37E